MDIPNLDVLYGVVTRVRLRLAVLTPEVIAVRSILVSCEPTFGAPPRRIHRPHLLYQNVFCLGFVLGVKQSMTADTQIDTGRGVRKHLLYVDPAPAGC